MIYVIATIGIKPGTFEQVIAAAKPCIIGTRAEEGCIFYDLLQSATDENSLTFVERWTDRAALDAHFKEPHMAVWREKGAQYITDRKIEIIDPADIDTL